MNRMKRTTSVVITILLEARTSVRRRACRQAGKSLINAGSFAITSSLLFLLLPFVPFSSGQEVQSTQVEEKSSVSEPVEPLAIKVSVNEVRIDVNVLDRRGNPITDLTADDFEVFQDGKRQKIIASVYIDNQSDAPVQSATDRNSTLNLQTLPRLQKEDVRRTIMFLVDNYSMSFENGYYTKMALRNFVEKQMQAGDLVAILRTEYGNSALNMFLSDKREALARINALPPTLITRPSAPPLPNGWRGMYVQSSAEAKIILMYGDFLNRARANLIENLFNCVSALENMPGRKIINVLTTLGLYDSNSEKALELKDSLLRAGIVVNTLNINGLNTHPEHGADASISPTWNPSTYRVHNVIFNQNYDDFEQLPEKTGGVYIRDSNFFLDGVGREAESLMKGYYLISYAPPSDTFEKRNKNDNEYRRLKVNVKRGGARAYTRDGFFGRLKSEPEDAAPQNPLIEAIYSPFQSTDITVNIAAGYVKDDKNAYLARSWIHLDPGNIKIVETEDGNRINLEAIYVASDINGKILDSNRVEFSLSKFNVDWVQKHGIRFSMLLPVKKPDSYYIRVSVQDKESGNVGSAYQFLEIPDLKKEGLALSDIFMITNSDDLKWIHSRESSEGVFFPSFQAEEIRSPALRSYAVGDNLLTLAMLYNADAKAIARSEIETQTVLYKDGKEFLRSDPTAITSDEVDDPGSIPLLTRFTVGPNLTPGDYALQIIVTDKKNGKKKEDASQILSFVVTE